MKKRSPILVIFMTVFIDLVGFGIILPLSPYLAREFNATPTEIGLLMAIYSLMQFLFAPLWGLLSDRFGRRPIILMSLFGAAVSYLGFAFAETLSVLFVARAFAGVFGANISAAQAYIADVTPPSERSKGMGLIGAAFGLGFVFGPLMGGLLGDLGMRLGENPPLGMSLSALGAAALCFANFVWAWFVLEESLPADKRLRINETTGKVTLQIALQRLVGRFTHLFQYLVRPAVGSLIWVFFLSGLAMAQMEAMLFPFVDDVFGWGLRTASYGFAYVGVLMVFTQGYLIRKVVPRFGDRSVLVVGLLLFAISLAGIAYSETILMLGIVMTVLAFGNGFMRPPNMGLISVMTPPEEQGAVMGVTHSVAALGRIVGPVLGGFLYQKINFGAPFLFASALSFAALLIVMYVYRRLPIAGKASERRREG